MRRCKVLVFILLEIFLLQTCGFSCQNIENNHVSQRQFSCLSPRLALNQPLIIQGMGMVKKSVLALDLLEINRGISYESIPRELPEDQDFGASVGIAVGQESSGAPRIVGTLPDLNNSEPQVRKEGDDFTIFVRIAGEMPEKGVYALTNMPWDKGSRIKERKVRMAFLKEMPSGYWLYGIKINATDLGPWWLNFEVDGRRTGNIAGNTALFVSKDVSWVGNFTTLSRTDVALTVNYNSVGTPFEIIISNNNAFTEGDKKQNNERTCSGFLHFKPDANVGEEEGITHLNWNQDSGDVEKDLATELGIQCTKDKFFMLVDRTNGKVYIRSGEKLLNEGLFFRLVPGQAHRFHVYPLIVRRDESILWLLEYIARDSNGSPIVSLKFIGHIMNYFNIMPDYPVGGNMMHLAYLKNLQPVLPEKALEKLLESPKITIPAISAMVMQIQALENIGSSI